MNVDYSSCNGTYALDCALARKRDYSSSSKPGALSEMKGGDTEERNNKVYVQEAMIGKEIVSVSGHRIGLSDPDFCGSGNERVIALALLIGAV